MSVFGMRDPAKQAGSEVPFDLPEEMAAAMRLMANPAAGVIAMSALGFGIASHALGLWAGTVTGAVQASQRLFAPLTPGAGVATPAAAPQREKPTLKVVATNEPSSGAPVAAPVKAAGPVVSAARRDEAPQTTTGEPVAKAAKAPASTPEPVAQSAKAESPLQPEDFHKPRTIERPAAPDDLKAISGIGPKLEKVLNDLGVWTYVQIATWEKREVAWLDDYLGFRGRIDRDAWIEQARALSSSSGKEGK
jgi:NADH-quinone oxidoreductase subunit E